MRRPRAPGPALHGLLLGVVLAWTVGCGPVAVESGGSGDPLPASRRPCSQDSDCTGNACCGLGTRPTHIEDAPNCSAVDCGDTQCPPDELECGRCKVFCGDSQCVAVCRE